MEANDSILLLICHVYKTILGCFYYYNHKLSLSPCTPFYAYSNHRDVCLAWCHSWVCRHIGGIRGVECSLGICSLLIILWIHTFPHVVCNHLRDIWDWLWFSCGIAHYRKSLISVFERVFASIGRILGMAGGLGNRLSFYGV